MKKKKILQYANWTGRDLFHYCLARSLVKDEKDRDWLEERDRMFISGATKAEAPESKAPPTTCDRPN